MVPRPPGCRARHNYCCLDRSLDTSSAPVVPHPKLKHHFLSLSGHSYPKFPLITMLFNEVKVYLPSRMTIMDISLSHLFNPPGSTTATISTSSPNNVPPSHLVAPTTASHDAHVPDAGDHAHWADPAVAVHPRAVERQELPALHILDRRWLGVQDDRP